MKILVAGGAGFVGTNLIKRLLKDGHEVSSVDNYSTGFKENHQDGCVYYDRDLSKSSLRFRILEKLLLTLVLLLLRNHDWDSSLYCPC